MKISSVWIGNVVADGKFNSKCKISKFFILVLLSSSFIGQSMAQLVGPVSPPPQGAVIMQTGTPNDGIIGRTGGKTWSYSVVTHADSTEVFWGVATEGVRLSLDGGDFSDPGEIMSYDAALSDLPNGVIGWTGQTTIITQNTGAETAFTRMIVTVTEQGSNNVVPLTIATDEGLATDVGAIVPIVNSATAINVNLSTQASLTNGSGYQPHLDFFDPLTGQSQDGMAYVSVSFGFYYENVAPFLTANVNNALDEGETVVITTADLSATDYESDDADITFVVGPDDGMGGNVGGPPQYGDLMLDDGMGTLTALQVGDSFTQDDLVNNRLSYVHGGNDVEVVDAFQFSVYDPEGAVAQDGQFTVFNHNFNITLTNDAPVAVDDSGLAFIDGTYSGTFTATDDDDDPADFTFSIISVDVGSANIIDATAGTFSYSGPVGPETAIIKFKVNDGEVDSITDGTFTVTIPENTRPVANDDSEVGRYASSYNGTFTATDLESPILTFSVVSSSVGVAMIIDENAGTFEVTYPQDYIGDIVINFQVFDGEFFSENDGVFTLSIPDGSLDVGDLLIGNKDKLILHNLPANTDYIISEGDNFSSSNPNRGGGGGDTGINAVAYGGNDRIYVLDQQNGLIRVDALTGDQTVLSTGDNFTNGSPGNLAIEDKDNLLVADLGIGLLRVNTNTGDVTTLTPTDETFNVPVSVDVATNNGKIYVGNAGVFAMGTTNIMEVDPTTGLYTALPSNGFIQIPISINFNDDIELVVGDLGGLLPMGVNQVIKVQIPAGTESSLSDSMDFVNGVSDLTITPDGMIYVATGDGGTLVSVDPDTGVTSVVPTDVIVDKPTDVVRIYDADLIFEDGFETVNN